MRAFKVTSPNFVWHDFELNQTKAIFWKEDDAFNVDETPATISRSFCVLAEDEYAAKEKFFEKVGYKNYEQRHHINFEIEEVNPKYMMISKEKDDV